MSFERLSRLKNTFQRPYPSGGFCFHCVWLSIADHISYIYIVLETDILLRPEYGCCVKRLCSQRDCLWRLPEWRDCLCGEPNVKRLCGEPAWSLHLFFLCCDLSVVLKTAVSEAMHGACIYFFYAATCQCIFSSLKFDFWRLKVYIQPFFKSVKTERCLRGGKIFGVIIGLHKS